MPAEILPLSELDGWTSPQAKERAAAKRKREKLYKDEERAHKLAAALPPRMRLYLAQTILNGLSEEGCSYADFQSAQAVTRGVNKARRALLHCN